MDLELKINGKIIKDKTNISKYQGKVCNNIKKGDLIKEKK